MASSSKRPHPEEELGEEGAGPSIKKQRLEQAAPEQRQERGVEEEEVEEEEVEEGDEDAEGEPDEEAQAQQEEEQEENQVAEQDDQQEHDDDAASDSSAGNDANVPVDYATDEEFNAMRPLGRMHEYESPHGLIKLRKGVDVIINYANEDTGERGACPAQVMELRRREADGLIYVRLWWYYEGPDINALLADHNVNPTIPVGYWASREVVDVSNHIDNVPLHTIAGEAAVYDFDDEEILCRELHELEHPRTFVCRMRSTYPTPGWTREPQPASCLRKDPACTTEYKPGDVNEMRYCAFCCKWSHSGCMVPAVGVQDLSAAPVNELIDPERLPQLKTHMRDIERRRQGRPAEVPDSLKTFARQLIVRGMGRSNVVGNIKHVLLARYLWYLAENGLYRASEVTEHGWRDFLRGRKYEPGLMTRRERTRMAELDALMGQVEPIGLMDQAGLPVMVCPGCRRHV